MQLNFLKRSWPNVSKKSKMNSVSKLSQNERMVQMMRRAGKRGVKNYEFPEQRILNYKARISELRQEGYNILVERVKLPNGKSTNVWTYTLIEENE